MPLFPCANRSTTPPKRLRPARLPTSTNMEQVQAICEAASPTDALGHHAGLGRRPQICRRALPAPPDPRRLEAYPSCPSSCTMTIGPEPGRRRAPSAPASPR